GTQIAGPGRASPRSASLPAVDTAPTGAFYKQGASGSSRIRDDGPGLPPKWQKRREFRRACHPGRTGARLARNTPEVCMRKLLSSAAVALFMAVLVAPLQAQNFQNGSAETIWQGNLRLTGSPVLLIGKDGGPDRTGGAFRLGYGLTDAFDVEAKTGFFHGFTLIGGDAHYRFLTGQT